MDGIITVALELACAATCERCRNGTALEWDEEDRQFYHVFQVGRKGAWKTQACRSSSVRVAFAEKWPAAYHEEMKPRL